MRDGPAARRGVVVVAKRVLRQMRRDRRTVAMILVQPIVMLTIFGYAFGSDVAGVEVAVANLDRGSLGADVLERLDPEVVDIVLYGSEGEVELAVERQDASVGIVFPVNLTRNFASAGMSDMRTAYVLYYADNTNPSVTGGVKTALLDAFTWAVENRTDDAPAAFAIDERVVFGPDDGGQSLDFMLPGIVAFTVFMIGSMLTVVSIVKERSSGTLPRILASPVTGVQVVLGFAAAYAVFSLLQAIAVLLIAVLLFDVTIQGNVALALVATLLVSVTALGLGILLSGLSKNEFQATQSVMLVAFPSMFLAGIFAPLEAMPAWVQPLSRLVPLTYAVEAERAIINHGAPLTEVLVPLGVLAAFAAFFLGLGAWAFSRKGG